MKMNSRRLSHYWRRPGLTLLEVVAGLTLLASLLVGTMLAYGSHIRQVKAAQRRLEAIDIAEQMLVKWYESEEGVPPREEDVIVGTDGWRWRTTPLLSTEPHPFRVRTIRFEIFDPSEGVEPVPLVYVDLLAPEEPEPPAREQGGPNA